MGVKQGCPLSPTLFGLCIDKLEEVIMNKVAIEGGLNAPKLIQHVILLLQYVNDVVLFSYDIDNMQHLLGVLEEFCHSSGLALNVEKTNMMVVQTIQLYVNMFEALNILVLMYPPQINGVHALTLGSKPVGNHKLPFGKPMQPK